MAQSEIPAKVQPLAENPKVNLLMAKEEAMLAEESALEHFAFAEALAEEAAEEAAAAVDLWERAVRRRMALAAPLTEAEVAEREAVRAAARRRAEMLVRRMREAEEEEEEEEERTVKEEEEEEDEEVLSTIDLTLSSGDEGGVCPLVPAVDGSIG